MDIIALLNYFIAFTTLFSVSVFILLFIKYRKEYFDDPKPVGWEPKVSVVMPAYNEGPYIGASIESLIEMDYPRNKLEIIIVDDGSTDDTLKVAQDYSAKYPRLVKAITKKNNGKGSALNLGLNEAKGELIATMDADSFLSHDSLRKLIPYFKDEEVMAVSPAVKIRPSGSWIKELQRIEYLMILFSRRMLSFIDSVPVTPGPFSIFRASVFEKIGYFDEHNLVEDQEIALRIQAHNFKIRSSMSADVFTEPPDNLRDLLQQRVRWQRGGFRNYWNYRHLIKPEYGDFGMYCVPLNFIAMLSFFLVLGLMIYSLFNQPYYMQYIWLQALGMSITFLTFIAAFVIIASTVFLWLAVKSFKNEKVKLRYLATFIIFYWYLMVGYNVLFLIKELRNEDKSW